MAELTETKSDLRICCAGELVPVRQTLQHVRHFLSAQDIPYEVSADIDLVLSEIMTNIVEHGYKDAAGVIECDLVLNTASVECRMSDTGRAFDPSGAGHTAPDPATFAEGGYGWFLVRSLTSQLSYAREGDRNILYFSMQRQAADEPC
ncbi:serine/threonine-protein kinase RsbW [Roseinatronobacter thiooxidans]|uniref:Serine/threonine-protein kinase RsbW n=1 Tax=Roseinatronobacter thiooxidans TaxID=121821 RepID=A0A2W7RVG6_9RHOB|nr:ATP-binding protein [Roseinatronobacter thiooxidans]PZX42142.1 serine/threonine-protein kinase RsbW [Roseinatronobacter thiooxidans]